MLTIRSVAAAALCSLLAINAALAADATVGPDGEKATPASQLKLSDAEVAKLKAGHHTAALLWHTSSDFVSAVSAGAKDEFKTLGIPVIAETDANFSAAKQMSDVETVMAKKPSVILTLPLDPVTAAQAFKPAVAAGVKIVLLSNKPKGYTQGKDYVTIVTDDLFQMGKDAADALADSLGKKGNIGYIYHDAQYYVTNQRDQAFKTTIEKDYPNIHIVAQAGIADPQQAQSIAQAMLLKHPDLDGVYVTWAQPAEGVLAALRQAGNKKTKIVTLDISEPIALDLAKGGHVVAIVADKAYELGHAMATAAGYGLLDKPAPAFVVAPVLTITKSNLAQGYEDSLHRQPPQAVLNALK